MELSPARNLSWFRGSALARLAPRPVAVAGSGDGRRATSSTSETGGRRRRVTPYRLPPSKALSVAIALGRAAADRGLVTVAERPPRPAVVAGSGEGRIATSSTNGKPAASSRAQ